MLPLAKLEHPAVVKMSYSNLTIYPLNTQEDAYRKDREIKANVDSIGLFAEFYNADSATEREKYKSFSYLGQGGMLKDNNLISLCPNDESELTNQNLDEHGQFSMLMSESLDPVDADREAALLDIEGRIVSYECGSDNKSLVLSDTGRSVSPLLTESLVGSFGLGGAQYGLLNNGRLVRLVLQNNTYRDVAVDLPVEDQLWVSATPMSLPELFN